MTGVNSHESALIALIAWADEISRDDFRLKHLQALVVEARAEIAAAEFDRPPKM
jgi:hypothetical protein